MCLYKHKTQHSEVHTSIFCHHNPSSKTKQNKKDIKLHFDIFKSVLKPFQNVKVILASRWRLTSAFWKDFNSNEKDNKESKAISEAFLKDNAGMLERFQQ